MTKTKLTTGVMLGRLQALREYLKDWTHTGTGLISLETGLSTTIIAILVRENIITKVRKTDEKRIAYNYKWIGIIPNTRMAGKILNEIHTKKTFVADTVVEKPQPKHFARTIRTNSGEYVIVNETDTNIEVKVNKKLKDFDYLYDLLKFIIDNE